MKLTKQQIARLQLKKEIQELQSEEEVFELSLKNQMEKKYQTKPLPDPLKEKEEAKKRMILEYEKEIKERERKFDEQIRRSREKREPPSFEYR